jgi:predicted ribosome quality control (RQC) complex YloA/Tae2 family protein
VDKPLHSSHHILALVARDLQDRLHGAVLGTSFSQDRDELVVPLADQTGVVFVSCSPALPLVFLHDSFARAKRNSVDLLLRAAGTTIRDVALHPSDRILSLTLSSGLTLEVQLFGPRSNVILLDATRTVVDAFKKSKQLVGTVIPVPATVTYPAFHDAVSMPFTVPGITVGATIKKLLPLLPPVVIKEWLFRADLGTGVLAREVEPTLHAILASAATKIQTELASPTPRIYSTADGTPLHCATIRLTHLLDVREEPFPGIHAALREFFVRRRSTDGLHRERQELMDALRRRMERAHRTMQAIRMDAAESDRITRYRQYGAILMENLGGITKGDEAWTATVDAVPVAIPLVPSLTPVQNAQRYFEKAKSAERSRIMTEDRLKAYGAVYEKARVLLAALEPISTRPALRIYMKENKEELRALGATETEQDQERAPFRVFTVHGGFEVWAGKSSTNNDELTLRHARPEDLWFHARGASGSHVILKVSSAAGEPGKRAKAEAAGIAAYYSKMKNAKIVPVAMTRRKYVHKPKGAPPGTVAITREEVIMATPGIPDSAKNA